MSIAITTKDIDKALGDLKRTAVHAGVQTWGWHVQGGSQRNGVAFRLVTGVDPDADRIGGGATPIGFTKREAHRAITLMTLAFQTVAK